jgi:hypothetical protein
VLCQLHYIINAANYLPLEAEDSSQKEPHITAQATNKTLPTQEVVVPDWECPPVLPQTFLPLQLHH